MGVSKRNSKSGHLIPRAFVLAAFAPMYRIRSFPSVFTRTAMHLHRTRTPLSLVAPGPVARPVLWIHTVLHSRPAIFISQVPACVYTLKHVSFSHMVHHGPASAWFIMNHIKRAVSWRKNSLWCLKNILKIFK